MPAIFSTQNPELVLAATAILWACLPTRADARRRWPAVSRRMAVAMAAGLPLLVRLLLLPWHPAPEPRLHDEFSFLLGSSTLLEGRLANPVPFGWVHFESMHMLCQPVYASAFPLAQAAVLALGTLLGHPWVGVWLSVGLLCGCLCWMLQGFMPPRWALYGALLVGLRLGVSGYWMNSYWGGAVAATGGALMLGALGRLRRRPHWRTTVVMGLGILLLANSRVVEGAVFGGLVVLVLAIWFARAPLAVRSRAWRQVALPLALALAVCVSWLALYFYRTTGNPLLPPYLLYRTKASMAPHFLWQAPRPAPLFNNRQLQHFYEGIEMRSYREQRQAGLNGVVRKAAAYWRFYCGPLLSLLLFALPWARRRCRLWLWVAMGAVFSSVLAVQVWNNPHYAAPALGLLLLVLVECARVLALWRQWGVELGRRLVLAIPVACVALLGLQAMAAPAPAGAEAQFGWRWNPPGGTQRAAVLRRLRASGGRHLVFVRYSPWHDPGNEWVFNEANLERARVVWARELDQADNARLRGHYAGRTVWLVEPDRAAPEAVPYDPALAPPMAFVALGAPGIAALRQPAEILRGIRSLAPPDRLNCEQWNWYFLQVTGVAGPGVETGCHEPGQRGQLVLLEHYFTWLLQQR